MTDFSVVVGGGSDVIFAVCHLVVLGSACANPVLYGWLNENFRREFVAVLCRRCTSGSGRAAAAPQPSPTSRADDERNAVDCDVTPSRSLGWYDSALVNGHVTSSATRVERHA